MVQLSSRNGVIKNYNYNTIITCNYTYNSKLIFQLFGPLVDINTQSVAIEFLV